MKKLALAVILTLTIAGSAFAGDIPSGDFVPPPTQPSTSSTDAKVTTTTDPADAEYAELSFESLETVMLTIVGMMFH